MALLIKYIFVSLQKKTAMNCPKCKSENKIKAGFIKGIQRYKCKECEYYFTVELKSTAKPISMKKAALHLYLEGLGFRSIGRILGVSNVSVLQWIRSFGEAIHSLHLESKEIEMVEADEMHSYIGSKKTTVGYGLLLIDMGNDSSTLLLATEVTKQQKNSGI
jgi:Transposase and inactivated derivatives